MTGGHPRRAGAAGRSGPTGAVHHTSIAPAPGGARAGRLERFYLGAPEPRWLAGDQVHDTDRRAGLAMFVSHRRLGRLRSLPRARLPWALDSGGFTELRDFGLWRASALDYARAVARYDEVIGNLEWAAPQDWMCEPQIRACTGLSVREHQHRTIENYLQLRDLWPQHSDDTLPVMPVVQGWTVPDYVDCVELYAANGVDLVGGAFAAAGDEPVVGVGSVCGRPAPQVRAILAVLDRMGIPLHGFGINTGGLRDAASMLVSADSMSWSAHARAGWGRRLPGCHHSKCTSCLRFALRWWRAAVLPVLTARVPYDPEEPARKTS